MPKKPGKIPKEELDQKLMEYKERIARLEKQLKSERAKSGESKNLSSQVFNTLINTTNLGMIFRDPDGKVTFANKAATNILGVSHETLMRLSGFEPKLNNILPDGSEMKEKDHPVKKALDSGKEIVNSIFGVYNPLKKSYIWISMTATPIVDEKSGSIDLVTTVFDDITEKLEADRLLKDSEERAKVLLDIIPDLILRISRDSRVIDFHGEAKGLFGKKRAILGRKITKLFNEELSVLFADQMEIAFDSYRVVVFDYKVNLENKGVCYFEFRISSNSEKELTVIVRDVTNQKRSQRKVVEAKRRLSTLMGNLPGMVYRCLADEYWTMLFVSDGVTALTGYTRDEINYNAEIAYNDIIHPEDRDKVAQEVNTASDSNERFSIEYRIITKQGVTRWVYEQGLTIKDKKDRPLFIEGYIADITAKKLAEENLKLNENKFRLLFNSLDEAVFVHPWDDNEFKPFVEVNDVAIDRYGYSRDEFARLTVEDIITKEEMEKFMEDGVRDLLKENGTVFLETFHTTKSGSTFPVEITANLINLNNTRYIQSVARDISDRRKAEERLVYKTDMEHLISRISSSFMSSSVDEVDELVNRSIENIARFIEVDRAYVFLQTEKELIIDGTYEWNRDGVESLVVKKQSVSIETMSWWYQKFSRREYVQVKSARELPVEAFVYLDALRKEDKSLLVIPIISHDTILGCLGFDSLHEPKDWNIEDISLLQTFSDILAGVINRKKYQQQLIFAKEKAEESDQLKSTFLASMSHELRTPLNAIIGFSTLVKPGASMDKIAKWNQIINSSGKHLLKIIESIFDVSLLQTKEAKVRIEHFSLDELFVTLQQYVKAELKKFNKIELRTHYSAQSDSEKSFIKSDRTKVIQLITNLLNNAIKYTEEGSINYGYKIEGNDVIFYVSDTGIGISEEHREVIFDIFRQIDDPYFGMQSGVGLGLAICKEISNLLGGELWLESEKGEGSCFYFRLRGVCCAKEISTKVSVGILPPDLKRETILVVEDIEFNYFLLEEMLSPTFANILWAKNGKDAVKVIQKNKDIALVLMDLKMPEMDGYQAAEEIKQINPDIPVIAQTAYALKEDKNKVLSAGFKAYISKPIDKDELYQIISSFLLSNTIG